MPSSLIEHCALTIRTAFDNDRAERRALLRRAQTRFEEADWHGLQTDAVERLTLREQFVVRAAEETRHLLGPQALSDSHWEQIKHEYARLCQGHPAEDFSRSFYNTVTRRVFGTVGVDPQIEFHDTDFDLSVNPDTPISVSYTAATLQELARACLQHSNLRIPFEYLERDVIAVARALEEGMQAEWGTAQCERADLLTPVFYRNKGAYLVGRLVSGERFLPMVIALKNVAGRVAADAVLLNEDEVSIVFSFTRSYFHVDLEYPRATVQFLKLLMPWKRIAELYISLGYPRHGKAELYRALQRHFATTDDQFIPAPGDKGMVMAVFTLPAFDVVFKVIRDHFAPPKTTTRDDVLQKYDLVFTHDRAGRLVDAQEFRRLALPRARFAPAVLDELLTSCASSVSVSDEKVILNHVYIERRITPLNLYLRERPLPLAIDAILDYGHSIKDLAATNIFPGDMLLKNFGVTRHARVIFYDYDELCLLTDCVFRDLPQASDDEDEWRGEPWFFVGDKDIFPEEFLAFMGLQGELRAAFLNAHGDLLRADYWRSVQAKHRAGEIMEIIPYRVSRRLG